MIGNDERRELARRLAAAYVSWHLQMTYQTVYKNHLVGKDAGPFWQELATHVVQRLQDEGVAWKPR